MKSHLRIKKQLLYFSLIVTFCLFASCAYLNGKSTPVETSPIASNNTYQVVESAEIEKIAIFEELYEGASRLHFEVTLKNISQENKRFRLRIYLPEGPSAGGLYPVKGTLEPQKSLTLKFPMYFSQLPSGFTVVVSELQP